MPVRSETVLTGLLSPDGGAEHGQHTPAVPASLLERVASYVGAGALARPDLGTTVLDFHSPTRAVAWDLRQRRLAVVDAQSRVSIYSVVPGALELKDGGVERLTHAGIHDIAAVAWRPNSKDSLAVAHSGGVCIWSNDALGTGPENGARGLGAPSSWRRDTLLFTKSRAPVAALAWSPCGQFLACGSPAEHTFSIWELCTRTCTRLREGFGGARLLRWSPRGNFLLVAGYGVQRFDIWETHTWTCQSWSTGETPLVDAAWLADETVVVLAFRHRVAALHFVKEPPSVMAHLLPLELPSLDGTIDGLALSSSALAVALRQDSRKCGVVNLYRISTSPVLAATFMGGVAGPHADQGLKLRACVAFSGSTLAVTFDDTLMLVET